MFNSAVLLLSLLSSLSLSISLSFSLSILLPLPLSSWLKTQILQPHRDCISSLFTAEKVLFT